MGLGANMREDTIYPTAYLDGSGNPLDSAYKYVMHFDKGQLPPTNATWSVSQYKGNFYERNVLDRYAISPWMPLKFNPDGSLDIYLQADSPGADKESNWLPTPSGAVQPDAAQLLPEGGGLRRNLQGAAGQEGSMTMIEHPYVLNPNGAS